MPWVDMLCELRKSNIPLCSLESHTPLSRFDIIGFTLQYEMSYTNVLEMMDLGGVPVLSSERGEDDPIVLAGGPCAFNPEPLHLFIDAFLIGDGEDSIVEVTDVLNACKKEGVPRAERPETVGFAARRVRARPLSRRVQCRRHPQKPGAHGPLRAAAGASQHSDRF